MKSNPRLLPTLRETFAAAGARFGAWLAGPLPAEVVASLRRLARLEDLTALAVLPDVHLARGVCVGTVLATRRFLYPAAVGGDIGCGMAAAAFEAGSDLLAAAPAAGRLLAGLYEVVPATKHRRPRPLPAALAATPLSHPRLSRLKGREARWQLGTLGRGNHFVEFQADDEGRLWLMVHSGSRAIGQAVRDFHAPPAGPTAAPVGGPTSGTRDGAGGITGLEANAPAGKAYLADAAWASAYADANRRAMVDSITALVGRLFGVRRVEASLFTCDHNHVRRETHFGEAMWVHRKGAIPAGEGEAGIIPGSMGAASFHVLGRGNSDALHSSSHGAGRAMTRQQARRGVSARRLEGQMRGVWFDHRLAPRLCEEAPVAYKDIHAVLAAERDLTRVVRRLRPVLCYKGV